MPPSLPIVAAMLRPGPWPLDGLAWPRGGMNLRQWRKRVRLAQAITSVAKPHSPPAVFTGITAGDVEVHRLRRHRRQQQADRAQMQQSRKQRDPPREGWLPATGGALSNADRGHRIGPMQNDVHAHRHLWRRLPVFAAWSLLACLNSCNSNPPLSACAKPTSLKWLSV